MTYCDQHKELRDMLIAIHTELKTLTKAINGHTTRWNDHIEESMKYRHWLDFWMRVEKVATRTIVVGIVGGITFAIVWFIRNGIGQ